MYLRVEKPKYLPRYKVDIEFNDGKHRIVDFGPFLKQAQNSMFTKYRLLKNFKSFHIEHGDLMWGDFEMIFPIIDLYRGSILKGDENAAPLVTLQETFSRTKAPGGEKTVGSVSYKKEKKLGRYKN